MKKPREATGPNHIKPGRYIRLLIFGIGWLAATMGVAGLLSFSLAVRQGILLLLALPLALYTFTGAWKAFVWLECSWFLLFGTMTVVGAWGFHLINGVWLLGLADGGLLPRHDEMSWYYLFIAGGLAGVIICKLGCGMIPHRDWSPERNAYMDGVN